MPVRLVVHADDFGLTPGINRAVSEIHAAGVLTSASLMSTAPYATEAVALSRAHPGLGVGCHLTFVDGTPASDPRHIPSLLEESGQFRPKLLDFLVALLQGRIHSAELELEAIAQIRHLQSYGVQVTHVDTHKHLHAIPRVADAILRAAAACGIKAVRLPMEPPWSARHSRASVLRRLEVWGMRLPQAHLSRSLQRQGLHTTTGTLGIAATGTLDFTVLRRTLQAVVQHGQGSTWELCCHPGYRDGALNRTRTRLLASREMEREALTQIIPEFLGQSTPGALRLIHYGELA